jgi:hypothetical protein
MEGRPRMIKEPHQEFHPADIVACDLSSQRKDVVTLRGVACDIGSFHLDTTQGEAVMTETEWEVQSFRHRYKVISFSYICT